MQFPLLLLFLIFLTQSEEGITLTGKLILPKTAKPSSARISLNNGHAWQIPRANGVFNFYDLQPGSFYNMQIIHRDYVFEK